MMGKLHDLKTTTDSRSYKLILRYFQRCSWCHPNMGENADNWRKHKTRKDHRYHSGPHHERAGAFYY